MPQRSNCARDANDLMRSAVTARAISSAPDQLTQHVGQNPTVAIRDQLFRGVDACDRREFRDGPVSRGRADRHLAGWLEPLTGAEDVERFASRQVQGRGVLTV